MIDQRCTREVWRILHKRKTTNEELKCLQGMMSISVSRECWRYFDGNVFFNQHIANFLREDTVLICERAEGALRYFNEFLEDFETR